MVVAYSLSGWMMFFVQLAVAAIAIIAGIAVLFIIVRLIRRS